MFPLICLQACLPAYFPQPDIDPSVWQTAAKPQGDAAMTTIVGAGDWT
jgi:hypothetical protein